MPGHLRGGRVKTIDRRHDEVIDLVVEDQLALRPPRYRTGAKKNKNEKLQKRLKMRTQS